MEEASPFGALNAYISNNPDVALETRLSMMLQVTRAVEFFSTRRIVHTNVCSREVFVFERGVAKVNKVLQKLAFFLKKEIFVYLSNLLNSCPVPRYIVLSAMLLELINIKDILRIKHAGLHLVSIGFVVSGGIINFSCTSSLCWNKLTINLNQPNAYMSHLIGQ